MHTFKIVVVTWILLFLPSYAISAVIEVTQGKVSAIADDVFHPLGQDSVNPISEGSSGTLMATSGNQSSEVVFAFSGNSQSHSFVYDMNFTVGTNYISHSNAKQQSMHFIANQDLTYTVTGQISAFGDDLRVYLQVLLYDLTTGEFLLKNDQDIYKADNPNLTVGNTNGDANTLLGTTSGLLVSGHSYLFNLHSLLANNVGVAQPSTAVSHMRLDLNAVTVSEPTTSTLFLSFLIIASTLRLFAVSIKPLD